MNDSLVFSILAGEPQLSQVRLFVESLREYGGELADSPVQLFIPNQTGEGIVKAEEGFDISVCSFPLDESAARFVLGVVPYAAAEAERVNLGRYENLVWVLPDTLVVNSPLDFILPEGVQVGYRPVHHTKVGPIYDQPLDGFWQLIYQYCETPLERVFPMKTCTRDNTLYPYINSGMLAVRPEAGFLQEWCETFEHLYRLPVFQTFYERDILYQVFMHQAVLAGVLLKRFTKDQLVELPEAVNYPLHLHLEHPEENRPSTINELTTARYEEFQELLDAIEVVGVQEPMRSWLLERLPG